jgi:hypothetical protein
LNARRALGEPIDAKNIRKHGSDVLRLSQMLAPDSRIKVAAKIAEDLDRFLGSLITDGSYDPIHRTGRSKVCHICDIE